MPDWMSLFLWRVERDPALRLAQFKARRAPLREAGRRFV